MRTHWGVLFEHAQCSIAKGERMPTGHRVPGQNQGFALSLKFGIAFPAPTGSL